MKILHLTSHLNMGGITRYVLSISKELISRGHDIVVASDKGQLGDELSSMGIEHWLVPLHTKHEFSPRVFSSARTLAMRLKEDPVDCLHAHTRVGQVVAARLASEFRLPYITTWHGFFRPNIGRMLWPCTGDVTIAISEPVRQHLLKSFHLKPDRIRLVPHGIDTEFFSIPVDSQSKQEMCKRIGIPQGAKIVGTITRLVHSKGVDHLIDSFVKIRQSVPESHLVIVGDGAARSQLEKLVSSKGINDVTHFSGILSDTRTLLSLMDVFVFLPAVQEGFGLSLLEAMAAGCPIVAIRQGNGAIWVLKESNIAALVEPKDKEGLVRAVVQILRNPKSGEQLGKQSRAVVAKSFTLTRMVDRLEAIYREAIVESW